MSDREVDGDDVTCGTVTTLLREARDGRSSALDDLLRLVDEDLRRRARPLVSQSGQHDLNVTALVQDAVVRLLGRGPIDANDRRHFFFVLERAMHDVMVEHVRRGGRLRRGGGAAHRELDDQDAVVPAEGIDALALRDAMAALRERDSDSAAAVLLRHHGEMTLNEIAMRLGCTISEARGHIAYGYGFLAAHLAGDRPVEPPRRRATSAPTAPECPDDRVSDDRVSDDRVPDDRVPDDRA